jgi:hypothetical protein
MLINDSVDEGAAGSQTAINWNGPRRGGGTVLCGLQVSDIVSSKVPTRALHPPLRPSIAMKCRDDIAIARNGQETMVRPTPNFKLCKDHYPI